MFCNRLNLYFAFYVIHLMKELVESRLVLMNVHYIYTNISVIPQTHHTTGNQPVTHCGVDHLA